MSQKIVGFGVMLIAIVLGWYFWPQPAIQIKALYQIQSSGLPLGTYQALVRFTPGATGDYWLSLDVDADHDGLIATGERALSGFALSIIDGGDRLLPFVVQAVYNTGISKQLVVLHIMSDSGQTLSIEQRVKILPYEIADRLRLDSVKNPDESMKGSAEGAGVGGSVMKVNQDAVVVIKKGETPDISQQIAECAPTAAVNSLLRLMVDHGKTKELQGGNPYQLIGELKGLMKRTPADGVTPDNFVLGKQAWTAKRGLPIATKKVGNLGGEGTLDALQKALDNGGAAELRLRFTNSSNKTVGGHMVTVTAVRHTGGQKYIDIHDPLSPKGTETYQLEGNKIIGYSMHNGPTYVSIGFIQIREEPTGTGLEAMTDEEVKGMKEFTKEKETIPVIIYQGNKIPLSQVHVGQGPECMEGLGQMPHYHSNAPDHSVKDVNDNVLYDTNPAGCGFGFVRDTPVEQYQKP